MEYAQFGESGRPGQGSGQIFAVQRKVVRKDERHGTHNRVPKAVALHE